MKKSDVDGKEERNTEEDRYIELAEDLDDDFAEKEHASPINLSIKNKKTQEEVKKPSEIGKDTKKLKQKKMEDFVKAVERVMPKKRKSKVEEKEARSKTEDSKAVSKSTKMASEKAVKKAKTSKRMAVEVLDLSHKEEPPVKIKKKKTIEVKQKKKKVSRNKEELNQSEKNSAVESNAETLGEQSLEVENVVENGHKEVTGSTVDDLQNAEKNGVQLVQETIKDLMENVEEEQDVVTEVMPVELEREPEISPSKSFDNDKSAAGNLGENGQDKDEEAKEVVEEESSKMMQNEDHEGEMAGEVQQKSQKKGEEESNKLAKKKGVSVEDLACKLAQNKESENILKDQNGEKSEEKPAEDIVEDLMGNGSKATEDLVQNVESVSPEKTESAPQTPSLSKEVFLKPSGRPPLFLQRQASSGSNSSGTKVAECEEDEGIHEAGSDVSDSTSECSDDSGLKMLTPTEEIPTTPTELKAHLCIFCDRTFPFKSDYQRHLNRHLVNVYYMDSSKAHK